MPGVREWNKGANVVTDGKEKTANQSVGKLMQLLQYLAESRVPMRLQDVAAAINVPQATTLRYLNALAAEGYVFRDRVAGRYAPTWKLCGLGEQTRLHMNLRTISGDVIDELTRRSALGICLVIEQDQECIYLDCIYDPKFSLMRIGKRTPMHAASSGKVLLSACSEGAIDQLIAQKGLAPLTDRTITQREDLLEDLARVRERGYALDDEECEAGLRCVAVPIYSYQGRPEAALSMFGSVEQLSDEAIQGEILPLLRGAAAEISFRLGGSVPWPEEGGFAGNLPTAE